MNYWKLNYYASIFRFGTTKHIVQNKIQFGISQYNKIKKNVTTIHKDS